MKLEIYHLLVRREQKGQPLRRDYPCSSARRSNASAMIETVSFLARRIRGSLNLIGSPILIVTVRQNRGNHDSRILGCITRSAPSTQTGTNVAPVFSTSFATPVLNSRIRCFPLSE